MGVRRRPGHGPRSPLSIFISVPVPTARLAIVAALASIAAALLPFAIVGSLLVVNTVLVLVALGDWWLAPRPSDIAVERDLPGVLPLGGGGAGGGAAFAGAGSRGSSNVSKCQ